ncbi:aa3-type cytochrome c oxidase subunit IV [Sphingobium sp. H39-3-25]|nr:aa3-type cytochrome c oxidase subunit IV [Sphingobium arseniciresistens]
MASGNDIKSATETYAGFVGVMKWGTIACIAVAALVILLISS